MRKYKQEILANFQCGILFNLQMQFESKDIDVKRNGW